MNTYSGIDNQEIVKVGLAVTEGDRVLLVRKRGGRSFILPGGKPERGEDDLETLSREIQGELGCAIQVDSVAFLGSFTDLAADISNAIVTVRLYKGDLIGTPTPKSEIEVLRWIHNLEDDSALAPSLRNQILPFLFSHAKSS